MKASMYQHKKAESLLENGTVCCGRLLPCFPSLITNRVESISSQKSSSLIIFAAKDTGCKRFFLAIKETTWQTKQTALKGKRNEKGISAG